MQHVIIRLCRLRRLWLDAADMGSPFFQAWQRLDYRALDRLAVEAREDRDRYLAVRCALVLGEYDRAEARLRDTRFGQPFFSEFLDLQLRLYRRQNLPEVAVALNGLTGMPDDEALRAEWHFVLGYLYQLLSEFKQGSRHHRLARESYLAAGLPGCAAVAVFNLCLGSNYLNARGLLLEQTRDLESLVEQAGAPSLRALSAQWLAYQALEREDYLTAEKNLRLLLEVSRAEGRRREVGAAGWLLAYVFSRTGAEAALEALVAELGGPQFAELTREHQTMLRELVRLARTGLLDADDARSTLRRWRRYGVDPILTTFLTDLVVEKLWGAQAYEAVLLICRRARREMRQQQQALALIDFRYAEARAHATLGDTDKARRCLAAYRADAEERGAGARVEKADGLAARLGAELPAGEAVVRVCPLTRTVIVGKRRARLDHQPKVFQLLRVLAEERRPVSAARLFFRIYGLEYHPLRHERRLSSLLERARRVLGATDAICRRDGMIFWSPRITARLDSPPTGELLLQWRRQQLLQRLRQAGRPLSISELENGFAVSRRTLQLDLEHFLRAGDIRTNGGTRGRTYFVEETDEVPALSAAFV